MTIKQTIMRGMYPLLQLFSAKKNLQENTKKALTSFYELSAKANDGSCYEFSQLKGKKVLIVNTASGCGYTPQYADLQKLYKKEAGRLMILAFPANDFKNQEKASDEEILEFCTVNYGVTFPLMKKSVVIKNLQQNKVFEWLTQKDKNGWNDVAPEWNFSKYLINEAGELTNYFSPGISPLGKEIENALNK